MRIALIVIALAACTHTGTGPQPKKVDPGFVGKHLLAPGALPALTAGLDVTLGDKVVYLGNTVESTRIVPGGPVRITHYWKVIESPGAGWKPFTLFRGEPGQPDFMALPDTDMAIAHGPATWRPGEIIEDPQELTLRPDWRSRSVTTLSVRLIQKGAHGVDERMAASGGNLADPAVGASGCPWPSLCSPHCFLVTVLLELSCHSDAHIVKCAAGDERELSSTSFNFVWPPRFACSTCCIATQTIS